MIQIQLPSGCYLLLTVPENYWAFHFEGDWVHAYPVDGGGGTKPIGWHTQVPNPGQWSIIGKGSELKEDDWKGIVPEVSGWSRIIYYNHTASGRDYRDIVDTAFDTATNSGLSLISSHNMKPETTLILKKIQP